MNYLKIIQENIFTKMNYISSSINILSEKILISFLPIKDENLIQEYINKSIFPSLLDIIIPAVLYAGGYSILRLLFDYFTNSYVDKILKIKLKKIKVSPMIESKFPYSNIKNHMASIFYPKINIVTSYNFYRNNGYTLSEFKKYISIRWKNISLIKKRVKFQEAFWRFIIYLNLTIVGYFCMFYPTTQKWILDTKYLWSEWPYNNMTLLMTFYYQLQLGCYFHQLLWTEINIYKSFEMVIHHIVTILLIIISYLTNFNRGGIFVFFIHDISDIFLESAKFINYIAKTNNNNIYFGLQWRNITDIIFVIFTITFAITRLYVYPFYIIKSVIYELYPIFHEDSIGYLILLSLAIILQILHLYWYYLIMKMVYKLFTTGIEKDERSDDEDEYDDEYDEDDEDEDEDNNTYNTINKQKKY